MNKEFLLDFEKEIGSIYEKGAIRAPIHLEGSKEGDLEDFLIKFFKDNKIDKNTWCFSTHRSHYIWLLSGRDPEELKQQIIEGHSMHIFGHKFFTSAIVSGVAPIALGVSKGLAMKGSKEKVYCFIGDMAGSGGLVYECIKYAEGWNLPIVYVILDNCFSVRANTCSTWGSREGKDKVIKYKYNRIYNHAGPYEQGKQKYVMF